MHYANQIGYSDIMPCEVVKHVTPKCVEIRRMKSELDPNWKPVMHAGGFAAHCSNQSEQRWIIEPQPLGTVFRIRLHKDGKWRDAYRNVFELALAPRRFYDFNF
jgi:hypothetical protein